MLKMIDMVVSVILCKRNVVVMIMFVVIAVPCSSEMIASKVGYDDLLCVSTFCAREWGVGYETCPPLILSFGAYSHVLNHLCPVLDVDEQYLHTLKCGV